MSTFLFEGVIFGPVKSRRLGNSLGINLLPEGKKICNFNCVYCECGWNSPLTDSLSWPDADQIKSELERKLHEFKEKEIKIDAITFAGNGEPTMHPQFLQIVDTVIAVRDQILPQAKIAVLSNATLIFKPTVREALKRIDMNILKLDSAIETTCRILNQPTGYFNINETIEGLKEFGNNCIIQTMFVRGSYNHQNFDNTTPQELAAWIDALKKISPAYVMIYTIARDTPAEQIQKITPSELQKIAALARSHGIKVSVSY